MRWLLLWLSVTTGAFGQEPGHTGPIRAIAADGTHIVSASFDGTAILWPEGRVLSAHDGAVNAVALLPGLVVTGGADGRVLVMQGDTVLRRLEGHEAPISAVATHGDTIASTAWDGTARLWRPDGVEVLRGHDGNVNAVAFTPDGTVVTAGYDGTIRLWRETPIIHRFGAPQNAVAVTPDGEIIAAGADGVLRLIGATTREVQADTAPLTALAISNDGATIAVSSIAGGLVIIDRASLRITTVLHGTERPIWALAFTGDEFLSGGASGVLRRWDFHTGRQLGTIGATPALASTPTTDRGAQIFRACSACHALTPDSGPRAGPSLHGLFGRRIGSLPGYRYSQALPAMDLIWTPETVSRLFEVGPQAFTPGTRMPEQVITDPEDRAALIRYLGAHQ